MNNAMPPSDATRVRRRRGRNWALFLALLALVGLIYGVTIVKIKAGYAP